MTHGVRYISHHNPVHTYLYVNETKIITLKPEHWGASPRCEECFLLEVGGRGWSFVLLKYKFSNYKNNICSLYHPGSQEKTHSAWILKKGIIYIELNSVYKWTRNSKARKTSNTGKLLSPLLLKEQGEKPGWGHQSGVAVWKDTPTPWLRHWMSPIRRCWRKHP